MIPRTLCFFWSYGTKISYLRYLSMATARMLHPDWPITLYQSDFSKQALAWNFHEFQARRSKSHDWSKEVQSILKIDIQTYQPSDAVVLEMPPPNQSDIFSYEMLYKHGGWYSDMDVIFVKSLDFVSEQPYAFVGFGGLDDWVGIFGARKGSWVMQSVYDTCIKNFSTDSYNSTGTFGILKNCSSSGDWQNRFQAGDEGEKNWRAPKEMFYPVRNSETGKLWAPDAFETPRPNTWTVHLYGGNQDYALMNKKISPEYVMDAANREWVCRYIRENRCGLFPSSTPVDPVVIIPMPTAPVPAQAPTSDQCSVLEPVKEESNAAAAIAAAPASDVAPAAAQAPARVSAPDEVVDTVPDVSPVEVAPAGVCDISPIESGQTGTGIAGDGVQPSGQGDAGLSEHNSELLAGDRDAGEAESGVLPQPGV